MRLRPSVWGAGKLLVLMGALVATFVVFAALAMRVAVRAREVQVPDLTARSVADAQAAVSALDLALRVEDVRRPDAQVPNEHVLGQDPAPGARARRQRTIRIWLSAGPRIVVAPRLIGESERAAQIRLTQEGLTAASVAEIRDASYAPGVVVAQDPPPDAHTSHVRLLVNRGEDQASYVMPDFIGTAGARALDLLRERGFRVTVVAQQSAPGIPAGVVIRQTPAGGYQVHPGDSISLEVSR
ncbi:MAG: PASTA domain-containing protein [Acidobacteriota bacterium]